MTASAGLNISPEPQFRAVGQHWFVAEIIPRKEDLALRNLAQQSFESFCPRFRKTRNHARRREVVLAPLFPGYLFVRFDLDRDPWRSINGTLGVRRLVASDRFVPRAMPHDVMTHLLSRSIDGVMMQILGNIEPGRTVRITSGPFADKLATIEALDAGGRVRVLLDILGGQKPIAVGLDSLEPA